MRWVRLHLKSGSRLALVALAIQLLLSFGHVHLDGFEPAATAAVAERAAPATPDRPAPPSPNSDRLAHDYCVLCAVMQLAATSLAAAPPSLTAPVVATRAPFVTGAESISSAAPYDHYRARGPPTT